MKHYPEHKKHCSHYKAKQMAKKTAAAVDPSKAAPRAAVTASSKATPTPPTPSAPTAPPVPPPATTDDNESWDSFVRASIKERIGRSSVQETAVHMTALDLSKADIGCQNCGLSREELARSGLEMRKCGLCKVVSLGVHVLG